MPALADHLQLGVDLGTRGIAHQPDAGGVERAVAGRPVGRVALAEMEERSFDHDRTERPGAADQTAPEHEVETLVVDPHGIASQVREIVRAALLRQRVVRLAGDMVGTMPSCRAGSATMSQLLM